MTARALLSAGHSRRRIAGVAAIVLACAAMASSAAVASTTHSSGSHPQPPLIAPASAIRYAVNKPLCATTIRPGQMSCFALQRVTVSKGTPGAYPYLKNSALKMGPAGGYTPADLAILYAYSPTVNRASQTVGIVDWFDDPHIASDLKHFDHHYGLPAETAKSFRKVNQNGVKSPLPSSADRSSAPEIALDVESVRSVCQTCKILLVEAKTPTNQNVSIAENTAVRLGATEVSNSFGGPEPVQSGEAASTLAAFNHPGVVITASTGDDGWYDWDFANNLNPPNASANAALFPSTDPDVVSVGGVGFTPNTAASTQYVWNNDGLDDEQGLLVDGHADGAGGGGCSQLFTAKSWQSGFPGYIAAGCGGKRLAADVSSLADPATGFDEYDTWGGTGWITVGGTSLASPIVAAMYALAGGSGGAAYPSESLYNNATLHPSSVTDITMGGNGFCGGDTPSNCSSAVNDDFGGVYTNPNALGAGELDCSFPRNNTNPSVAPPVSSECNAVTGFDGPSGVGAPAGVSLFTSTSPKISLTVPKVFRLHAAEKFTATATARLAGALITGFTFSWGDGQKTTGTATDATHKYSKAGSHTVTLTVTDNAGQQSVAHTTITVGTKLSVKVFGPATFKAHKKADFNVVAKDPNTGGKITKVRWNWGDHKTSKGTAVSHTWRKAGKYRLTVTVTDNTGITTTFTARLTVKS